MNHTELGYLIILLYTSYGLIKYVPMFILELRKEGKETFYPMGFSTLVRLRKEFRKDMDEWRSGEQKDDR